MLPIHLFSLKDLQFIRSFPSIGSSWHDEHCTRSLLPADCQWLPSLLQVVVEIDPQDRNQLRISPSEAELFYISLPPFSSCHFFRRRNSFSDHKNHRTTEHQG
ncbi:uncharacterized protein LOC119345250 [Triticum dicoccoides]|uniref:uncharacterized protein LOC119345250 n=1 Tax=Triticum dicoccoides TaxID=85692 RepID=UPI00188ED1E7|nr:uncharacterized protein LOC119345250 [Triticum dicoccoides]